MGMQHVNKSFLSLSCLFLSASLAQAAPIALNDNVLDTVTAGSSESSGSGGAIVGNSSEATIKQTGGVELGGEVQSSAKALNLVNSAESTVANGVNVWEGNGAVSNLESGLAFSVGQSNVVSQEQRRSASMPSYSRPEADTFVSIDASGSEKHNNYTERNNTLMDVVSNKRIANNTSSAEVDTTIAAKVEGGPKDLPKPSVDTNTGKGLAIAGQLDATLDGGEMHLGLAVGGPLVAHPDVDSSDSGYGGMDIGNEDSDFTLYGRLILPELHIEINGAGCGVAMGSCKSKGTAYEDTLDVRDDSTIDTLVDSAVGNSEFSKVSTEIYRSPFELNDAQAEYIVVDDSNLQVTTTFTLSLSGAAQSGAMGMNVVNSTGSAVANGVNVAKTNQVSGGNVLALTQSNLISHSR